MNYKFCFNCGARYSEFVQVGKYACNACGFVFYKNSKPTASAIVVKDGKILLGKRRKDPFKGYWDVPGGFLELGEHPLDGVKRELKEETGLEIEVEEVLGFFMDKYGAGGDETLNISFVASIKDGTPRADDDITELAWFSVDEIPEVAFENGKEMIRAYKNKISKL
jgi:8-oxo-dGTP diphosphatase